MKELLSRDRGKQRTKNGRIRVREADEMLSKDRSEERVMSNVIGQQRIAKEKY